MITPLKYAAIFRVEADSREALEAAVEYVARRLEIGKVVYACGPHVLWRLCSLQICDAACWHK
jgi:hypothetical protein